MKPRIINYSIIMFFVLIGFCLFSSFLFSAIKDNSEIFKSRRSKILEKMEPNTIAIFKASDEKVRSGDENYYFKQDPNFYYLTGLKESESILILSPDGITIEGKTVKEILFLRERNPIFERWNGELLGIKRAKEELGFESALPITRFNEMINSIFTGKKVMYTPANVSECLRIILQDKSKTFNPDLKMIWKEKYPNIELKTIQPIISGMRQIKSEEEIQNIQNAINATCKGFIEAAKSCEPEMYEYELQAIIEYAFKRFGCESPGFASIIGSGPNSLVFHYDKSNRKMKDGDVVIMDIGGEYNEYSADITRTIPVNGKFSEPQKEIYQIVLKANMEAIDSIKPGAVLKTLTQTVFKNISEGLLKLGFIKKPNEAQKFIPHGISHDIGLDVHDVSTYGPLRAGQVITIEPGIYIPENTEGVDKKYWNIGVRIEDDVLVTNTGHRVLSSCAPKEIAEIEKLMKKKGIGNQAIGE